MPLKQPMPLRRRRSSDAGWGRVRGLLWFYVLYLATILPLAWLPAHFQAVGMIVIGIVDLVVVLIARRQLGGAALDTLRPTAVARSGWLLAVAAVVLLIPINLTYHWLVTQVLGLGEPKGLSDPFELAGFGFAVQFAVVVIQPAVVEELAFRGILQTGLSRIVGRGEALLLTAFAFGIIHLAWLSLPYLVLVGLALGWVRQRTGSLLPCMLLHALHNFAVLMLERAAQG